MPTDQEKLAIAEQITRDCLARSGTLHTDGFDVTHFYDSKGAMFIAWVGHDKKSESRSAIECIYAARQKLAAEKEAARTPEERRLAAENERLRKAIVTIRDYASDDTENIRRLPVLHECQRALQGAAQ